MTILLQLPATILFIYRVRKYSCTCLIKRIYVQYIILYAELLKSPCSFFPPTIRDWNALPGSLISSTEDAEDCVAKFTSLVRARD